MYRHKWAFHSSDIKSLKSEMELGKIWVKKKKLMGQASYNFIEMGEQEIFDVDQALAYYLSTIFF